MKKIVPAPYIDQTERWVNGCESISSVMLLQAVGIDIDPDTFIARDLPHAPYWEQDGKLYGPDPWQVYPFVCGVCIFWNYCFYTGRNSGWFYHCSCGHCGISCNKHYRKNIGKIR